MDIMDIHDHFWIHMDMDMMDIQMDIQKWISILISMSIMDIQPGYLFWICMDVDMVDIQNHIQNTYPYRISMSIMDIQHGYHVWISIISMISRGLNCMKGWTKTKKSYPEVHYFHDKLNKCEQNLMVALNELDTSQHSIKQLESLIQGSL